jgi:hypothetical protein
MRLEESWILEQPNNEPKVVRILEVLRESVKGVWKVAVLKTHLSSGRGNLSVMLVVITFYSCLTDGDTPQLPGEHRTNSQAHHETHEVDDSEQDGRHPMLPGIL